MNINEVNEKLSVSHCNVISGSFVKLSAKVIPGLRPVITAKTVDKLREVSENSK